jgi:hypothetical protein
MHPYPLPHRVIYHLYLVQIPWKHLILKNDSKDIKYQIKASTYPDKSAKPEHTNFSAQCAGFTKKGKHFKRMTKSSNGFCWQHGGCRIENTPEAHTVLRFSFSNANREERSY